MSGAPTPPVPGGPAPPGGPPPSPTCPKCRSPVAATSRFCPNCGASLSASPAAASPAPAAPPVDIRQRVDQDRGTLKRLQLLIPGFRGYRQGEDIRDADGILRIEIADKMRRAIGVITQHRQALSQAGQFSALNDLSIVLADLNRLEGEIRHGQQGYTGISPAVRVNVAQLDRLYEYDYGFALAADDVAQSLAPLSTLAPDPAAEAAAIANVREKVNRLEQAFRARIQVVEAVQLP